MTYRMITVNGTAITAPDMHGETGEPFIPFSVRGPLFLQLRDGTLLYFFGIKYTSQADEAMGCQALMRSHDGGKTWGEEFVISTSERNASGDLGYPTSVQMDDGSIITLYYDTKKGDSYCSLLYTKWQLEESAK